MDQGFWKGRNEKMQKRIKRLRARRGEGRGHDFIEEFVQPSSQEERFHTQGM
jgi:hypothetical protein